ncbi:unnamed protein product, partial [Prorocentrum cordatum]
AKLRAKFADNKNDSGDEGEDLLAAQVPGGASKESSCSCWPSSCPRRGRERACTPWSSSGTRHGPAGRVSGPGAGVAGSQRRCPQEGGRGAGLPAAGANMHANLGGKKEALLSDLLQIAAWAQRAPVDEDDSAPAPRDGKAQTRLGMRHFLGQTLVAPLGEALFECQRFKSKENEAVSTAEGEMAFVAMYLRMYSKGGAQAAF